MRNIQIKKSPILIVFCLLLLFRPAGILLAQEPGAGSEADPQLKIIDTDGDALTDYEEINSYRTDPSLKDTDGDGYGDGEEIQHAYDPNKSSDDKLAKVIGINLRDQTLTYSVGFYVIKTIKISSGRIRTPTPAGELIVLAKKPLVHYRGLGYNYPNTKWNLLFKKGAFGNFYIHGAYWHNNFGKPMSHGCVNVSYQDMEALYNWAEEGTKIIIE